MIEDKIAITLKDISIAKEKLKNIKKDMKAQEKIESDEYKELKAALKQLKDQIRDVEESHMSELATDDHYQKLREMKIEQEEEVAHQNALLFTHLAKCPNKAFKMNVDTEVGVILVQVNPEMRIYLNGREEKPRA